MLLSTILFSPVLGGAETFSSELLPKPADKASLSEGMILTWPAWKEGLVYSASLERSETGIKIAEFKISQTVRPVAVHASRIQGTPISIKETPAGDVYNYFQVSFTREALRASIETKFYFEVDDSWIEFNTLEKEDILLMAYDYASGKWVTLDTELDEGVFSAETTSKHALFSIVGLRPGYQKAEEPKQEQTPAEEPVQVVVEQPEPEAVPEVPEPPAVPEETLQTEEQAPAEEQGRPYGIFGGLVLLIAGVALVFLGVRLWKRR